MKRLTLLFGIILVATARAESLQLILVPQQIMLSPGISATKFDLFLYNAGNSARTVPSLEQFRAFYTVRPHDNSTSKSGTEVRAFSHRIKDHTLKAGGVDHAVIEIDLSSEGGDYVEVHVQIGHDERTLASNSVLLRCSPENRGPAESVPSPTPTPK